MPDEVEPGLSEQYRKASPWPLFVALGFVLSEVGIILGLFPIAVGGLLLFGGTVAGILGEAGYVDDVWAALVVIGGLLLVAGAVVVLYRLDLASVSLDVLLDPDRPFVYRGASIATAGLVLAAVGAALRIATPRSP